MLKLSEIEQKTTGLAAKIKASTEYLPTFGRTENFARPHIEVDSSGYHYVAVNRGVEQSRQSTTVPNDLLYWIFCDVTLHMASKHELAHRGPTIDPRRVRFARQLNLLGTVDPQFKSRRRVEIDEILTCSPQDDVEGT